MVWSFRRKLTILFILLFPLLLSLGFWQFSRYAEKKALMEQFEKRFTEAPVSLDIALQNQNPRYRRISLSGYYDNQHTFLLDNRINNGQPGYEVFTPFTTQTGEIVLVNRGWISRGQDRSVLPEIPVYAELTRLQGQLYKPLGKAFVLGHETWSPQWPQRMQALDMERIQDLLGKPLVPYFLVLDEQQSGSLNYFFKPVVMSPAKHMGYAVQWFLMAACLLILVVYRIYKTGRKQVRE